jgi:hypothetical protein
VFSSTPVHLSPGSSLVPISDPFTQFQFQSDYFSDASFVSPFDYSRSTPGLAAGGLFSKNVFDAPLGSDYLFHAIPAPITPNSFERNFSSTYAVF